MRVLILSAGSGGGHDMRADAFVRWAGQLTQWETRIDHPLENGHSLYRFGIAAYNTIQRRLPAAHHLYFNFLEIARLHRDDKKILGAGSFSALIESYRPNLIVSTHPHLNHAYFALARGVLGRTNVRCVTYCGELGGGYGFSRHWVNPDADLFIGALEETVDTAVTLGMPKDKTWVGGFLLFPSFYEEKFPEDKRCAFVREELGFCPNEFTLLLATGHTGANNHLRILRRLERRGKSLQVAVLCGNSEKTFDSRQAWSRKSLVVKTKALRFRHDMSIILQSVSVVVARPGSGLTSEAVLSGCPLMMNTLGGVMPQESITVRYAQSNGVEPPVKNPHDVVTMLDRWESNPNQLTGLRESMSRRAPTCHPREILEKAAGFRLDG